LSGSYKLLYKRCV